MSTENVVAAENAIRNALEWANDEEATSITHAMVANALATVALVEQQRIANLIALGQFRVAPSDIAHFRHVVAQPKDEFSLHVSPQIAEALGLS